LFGLAFAKKGLLCPCHPRQPRHGRSITYSRARQDPQLLRSGKITGTLIHRGRSRKRLCVAIARGALLRRLRPAYDCVRCSQSLRPALRGAGTSLETFQHDTLLQYFVRQRLPSFTPTPVSSRPMGCSSFDTYDRQCSFPCCSYIAPAALLPLRTPTSGRACCTGTEHGRGIYRHRQFTAFQTRSA
jgi:hypothetical protein